MRPSASFTTAALCLPMGLLSATQATQFSSSSFFMFSSFVTASRQPSSTSVRSTSSPLFQAPTVTNHLQSGDGDKCILVGSRLRGGQEEKGRSSAIKKPKQYYLLSDPGFVPKLALNALGMGLTGALILKTPLLRNPIQSLLQEFQFQALQTSRRYLWTSSTLVGLLSSSCCALQLLLNLLSVGCAGFNTILGPIRPTLLAVALWMQALSLLTMRYPTRATSVSLLLSFLPELLALWTKWTTTKADASSTTMLTDSNENMITIQLDTMGCMSCVNKVSSVLEAEAQVERFSVSLEQGQATVVLNQTGDSSSKTSTIERLLHSLTKAGFPASLII